MTSERGFWSSSRRVNGQSPGSGAPICAEGCALRLDVGAVDRATLRHHTSIHRHVEQLEPEAAQSSSSRTSVRASIGGVTGVQRAMTAERGVHFVRNAMAHAGQSGCRVVSTFIATAVRTADIRGGLRGGEKPPAPLGPVIRPAVRQAGAYESPFDSFGNFECRSCLLVGRVTPGRPCRRGGSDHPYVERRTSRTVNAGPTQCRDDDQREHPRPSGYV